MTLEQFLTRFTTTGREREGRGREEREGGEEGVGGIGREEGERERGGSGEGEGEGERERRDCASCELLKLQSLSSSDTFLKQGHATS